MYLAIRKAASVKTYTLRVQAHWSNENFFYITQGSAVTILR